MGAFSNGDYELQNNEAAVSNAFMEDDDMDMPQTVPAEPTTGSFPPDTEPAPATAVSEPSAVSDTQSEDEARRAHEAAEAKRKAACSWASPAASLTGPWTLLRHIPTFR